MSERSFWREIEQSYEERDNLAIYGKANHSSNGIKLTGRLFFSD